MELVGIITVVVFGLGTFIGLNRMVKGGDGIALREEQRLNDIEDNERAVQPRRYARTRSGVSNSILDNLDNCTEEEYHEIVSGMRTAVKVLDIEAQCTPSRNRLTGRRR